MRMSECHVMSCHVTLQIKTKNKHYVPNLNEWDKFSKKILNFYFFWLILIKYLSFSKKNEITFGFFLVYRHPISSSLPSPLFLFTVPSFCYLHHLFVVIIFVSFFIMGSTHHERMLHMSSVNESPNHLLIMIVIVEQSLISIRKKIQEP